MSENRQFTVEATVNFICSTLGITKRELSRLIGVNESSIRTNLKKNIDDAAKYKVGKRIATLAYIVSSTMAQAYHRPEVLINGMYEPTVSNILLSRKESVIQAIQEDRPVDPAQLLESTNEGVRMYLKKVAVAETRFRDEISEVLKKVAV